MLSARQGLFESQASSHPERVCLRRSKPRPAPGLVHIYSYRVSSHTDCLQPGTEPQHFLQRATQISYLHGEVSSEAWSMASNLVLLELLVSLNAALGLGLTVSAVLAFNELDSSNIQTIICFVGEVICLGDRSFSIFFLCIYVLVICRVNSLLG